MFTLLFFLYQASAGELSTGSKTTKSISKEKSQGIDLKQSDEKESRGAVSLALSQIFYPAFLNLEARGVEPFSSCKVVSHPMLAGDLGYQFEFRPGLYDPILKQIKDIEIAQNNRLTTEYNNKLLRYKNCMAIYGAIMAQGGLYMKSKVSGGDQSDLVELAETISMKIAREGITNKSIKKVYSRIINEGVHCRYAGSAKDFICGSTTVSLMGDSSQKMTLAGMNIYAPSQPFGYNVEFSMSATSKKARDIILSEKRSLSASRAADANAGVNAFSFIQK